MPQAYGGQGAEGARVTRSPSMNVPLVLPRSTISHPSPLFRSSTCSPLTTSSFITIAVGLGATDPHCVRETEDLGAAGDGYVYLARHVIPRKGIARHGAARCPSMSYVTIGRIDCGSNVHAELVHWQVARS